MFLHGLFAIFASDEMILYMEHPENNEQYKGLKVNDGVEALGPVNPYLATMRRKRAVQLSVDDYVQGILRGDVTVLSRAVTLLESMLPEHQAMAQEVVERCLPYSGKSLRVGITGVPGAGKSTSIDAFGMYLLANKPGKLAVLAVDPSSERSKGSIMGDKTRMERLSAHPRAFIRPSASAGSLGGVARKTRETIILCEAAGYDNIFVETVGVGQSETAVYSMVDFFLLIQIAGAGDELQGIKRGIMEMADGIVINKADGDNAEEARRAAVHYRNALQLFPMPASGMRPQVLTYSGFFDLDIDKVWGMIDGYVAKVKESGYFDERRRYQQRYWMREAIEEQLKARFYNTDGMGEMLARYEQLLLQGKTTSFAAAAKVLEFFDKEGGDAG